MVEIKHLSNGIRVVMEELPYFSTVTFGVFVHVGSVNESKKENGLAHILEHMFFKGTTKKSAKEIADTIAGIGDEVNAYTSKEHTVFYGTTITQYLVALIELLGDLLLHSNFDIKDIKKEKRVILDEIDMYEDSPEDLVHEYLQKNIWKNHSLGYIISGNKSNVKRFSRSDIIKFKEKFYSAEHIVISIAGNFKKDIVMEQLETIFGEIKRKIQNTTDEMFHFPTYTKCFCSKYKEIEQMYINMAFSGISSKSEERYAFLVMNSLFGGSNNSRLFQCIREELGLAYSVYSYSSIYELAGLFHIDVTVNPVQACSVLMAIRILIEEFTSKEIEEEEVRIHKAQIKTELIMSHESPKTRMNANAKSIFLFGEVCSLEENLRRIDLVTAEEVAQIAKKYLRLEENSLCVIGAREDIIKKQIRKWWEETKKE